MRCNQFIENSLLNRLYLRTNKYDLTFIYPRNQIQIINWCLIFSKSGIGNIFFISFFESKVFDNNFLSSFNYI